MGKATRGLKNEEDKAHNAFQWNQGKTKCGVKKKYHIFTMNLYFAL
jgi:hypothetical protein